MPQRRGGRGRKREARAARPERNLSEWAPKTKLGRLVLAGELTTLGDAIRTGLPIREPEIVDVLLPETEDEVLDVNMVQRMTDSGRRVNFVITCIVGNKDGFAGLGRARGREVHRRERLRLLVHRCARRSARRSRSGPAIPQGQTPQGKRHLRCLV